jgi:hypothetical protein
MMGAIQPAPASPIISSQMRNAPNKWLTIDLDQPAMDCRD